MDYKKCYDRLIDRAKKREPKGYVEKHHVIPRCIGGADDNSNIVCLYPREHYIAHLLLVKINPGEYGLVKAAQMMTVGHVERRSKNRMYGWLRSKFIEAQSISQIGEANSQYGTKWIYNEATYESKKIGINLPNPPGWVNGRRLKQVTKQEILSKQRSERVSKQRKEKVEEYKKYLQIYNEVGFERFVKLTNYKFSQPNLVACFKRYIPSFKPQNGKKRGKQ